MADEKKITIALAGNPNCGKTTLFNSLTGATAYVGNWPGVTVEKRSGTYKNANVGTADVVDLPGIYSLSPYSPEEVISRNFILEEKPDVVINVLDGTNLERNLYMTTQIMEMDVPVVIAVNMLDAVAKAGQKIDTAELTKKLGVPVIGISALKKENLDTLMTEAIKAAGNGRKGSSVLENDKYGKLVSDAKAIYENAGIANPLFHAVKALENDELEVEKNAEQAKACLALEGVSEDFVSESINVRYDFITKNLAQAKVGAPIQEAAKMSTSDKIDKVLTNRWAGIPIFLVILFLVFHLTFAEDLFFLSNTGWGLGTFAEGTDWEGIFYADGGIMAPGTILANALNAVTGWFTELVRSGMDAIECAPLLTGFVCDGVLGGVFAVAGFLPQILVLFFFFSIMEDSGYMARVAFILDRLFRRFGLSGKAVLPMIMGFGCGVPAMINTRTLTSDKERTQTIRVIPFFACSAKLPILVAVAGAIVSSLGFSNPDIITYSMYIVGVIVAICAVLLMHNTTLREKVPPFIMELPAYHLPQPQALAIHVWDKAKHAAKKLFTIILVSTIAVWLMVHISWDWQFLADAEFSEASSAGFEAITNAVSSFGSAEYEFDAESIVAALTQNDAMNELAATALVEKFRLALEAANGDMENAALNAAFQDVYKAIVSADVDYLEAGAAISNSILASLGKFVQPIFTPCGFGSQTGTNGWVYSVAVVNGLIAKENVISTFATLSSSIASSSTTLTLTQFMSAADAEGASDVATMINNTEIGFAGLYAFMAFNVLTIPCFASVATANGELKKGELGRTLLFWLVSSYLVAAMLYTSLQFYWPIAIWVALFAAAVVGVVFYNKKMTAKEKLAEAKAA